MRIQMNYTVRDFAALLGLPAPTYQGYEDGRRKTPEHVLIDARAAQKREVEFFRNLPKRVDKALAGKGVPNERRRGEW